jgi:oxalate decarboxylase/phosphoglucose isomerase-like protein (cupin superfamily)
MAEVEFIDLSGEMPKDGRGFAFFPWQGREMNPAEVLRTGHLVSILPGQTRGNHYHPGQEEWLFTFHGTGVLVWEAAGKIRERLVAPDGTLIRLPPGIAHALTNPGPKILYLLAWRQPAGEGGMEPESVPKRVR